MPRGRAPGFAVSRPLSQTSSSLSPQARATDLYRIICDEELPAEVRRDVSGRIAGSPSKYSMLRWNGVPHESEVHRLIPAMLCMRFTDLSAAHFGELRQRLITLMNGHISDFEEALARVRVKSNQRMLAKTFGLLHPERPHDVEESRRDLNRRLSSFEKVSLHCEQHTSNANSYRMSILSALVNNAVARELAAGHAQVAHHLRVIQVASIPGGENERRRAFEPLLGRQCAAIARLDRGGPTGDFDAKRDWLVILGGRSDLLEEPLADRLGSRLAGDQAERMLAEAGKISHREIPVCADSDSALAQARGLLRNPCMSKDYREARAASDAARPRISVVVEEQALRDLDQKFRDGPGWRGYGIAAPPASDPGSLAISLRLEVGEYGVGAQINFVAPIGQTTARDDEERMREIRVLTAEHLSSRISDDLERSSASWEWGGKSIALAEQLAVGPTASTEEALGPDVCDHSGAGMWVPSFALAPKICDTLTLCCSRCLRSRVAGIPLHRLPPEHPVASHWLSTHEEAYLRLEAAHSLLAGKRLCRSGEDLRVRDGMASLDPASYATGGPRPRPSVASVSAAMHRR